MADILLDINTLLTSNWTASNTGGVTPKIDVIFDHKRIDLKPTAIDDGDFILTYINTQTQVPSGVNFSHKNVIEIVTVDLRSMVSRAHSILLRDEIKRIFDSKFKNPITDVHELETTNVLDLSDKTRSLWRFVFTVELRGFHISRT